MLNEVKVMPARTGDLGPHQLEWLREHVKPFDLAWRAVQAADQNAAKVRAELGLRQ